MEVYNIYCDESSIENKENRYMIIGALFMEREKRDELREKINNFKKEYNYKGEIKWNKISKKMLPFYKKIIDLFFDYPNEILQFHCIKIDRNQIKYDVYHHNNPEEGFYKFYYQLFKNKFKNNHEYYIFLDYKPTKLKDRVSILEYYLKYRIATQRPNAKIKHVQAYSSKENIFIQLADLFCGAVGHSNNIDNGSHFKKEIIEYLAKRLIKNDLKFCSLYSEKKFNIFCINLTK